VSDEVADVSATESELLYETEIGRVVEWRKAELMRAGYGEPAARRLAERLEVDLHRAIDLLRQGCPSETAERILL
jgi:hypothetical protein